MFDTKMIKISTQPVFKYSKRLFGFSIPDVFTRDNNIKQKDELEVYREIVNGKDALIIIPIDKVRKNK